MSIFAVKARVPYSETEALETASTVVCATCGGRSSAEMDIPVVFEQLAWANYVVPYGYKICFACFLGLPTVEQNAMLASHWLAISGVPHSEISARFSTFDRSESRDVLYNKVHGWSAQEDLMFLALLSSKKGIGKTHLAIAAMAEYFIRLAGVRRTTSTGYILATIWDKRMIFVKERDLTTMFRESYERYSDFSESDILKELYSVDFLVIDDLLSNKKSDFDRQIFLNILDHRMDSVGKRTIFTSNESLSQIAKFDERLSSRLSDQRKGLVVSVESLDIPDYRLQATSVPKGSVVTL